MVDVGKKKEIISGNNKQSGKWETDQRHVPENIHKDLTGKYPFFIAFKDESRKQFKKAQAQRDDQKSPCFQGLIPVPSPQKMIHGMEQHKDDKKLP